MAIFRYEAADASGKIMRGAMDAPTPQDVLQRLSSRGYQGIQVLNPPPARAVMGAAPRPPVGLVFGASVRPEDMGLFFRQLTSLVHAGFTVGSALTDLAPRTSNRALRAAATHLAQATTRGATMAGEMERFPTLFAPHVIGLVAAGEAGGFVEFAFEEAALGAEQDAALGQGLWLARFLIWQSVWSVILLQPMVNFLPLLIKGDFAGYGRMLVISWIVLGILAHGGAFIGLWLWRQPGSVVWRDRLSLHIPVLARLAKMRALASFTRVLRRLLQSAISPEPAFAGAARSVPNIVLSERTMAGVPVLRTGNGIDAAVQATGMMGNDPLQLLITGQKTGQWLEMLEQVTAYYQEEAARAMQGAKAAQKRLGVLLTILSTGYVTIVLTWAYSKSMFQLVDNLMK